MSLATTMTLLLISGLHLSETVTAGDRHEPLPGSPLSSKEYEKFFSVLMQQQGGLEALCAIRLRSGCRNRLLIPLDKYENHGAIPKGPVCSSSPDAPYFKDFCTFAEHRCEKKKYTLKRVKCVGDIMYEKTHTSHRESLDDDDECNRDDSRTPADEDTDDIMEARPVRRKITNWMFQTSTRAHWRTSQRVFREDDYPEIEEPFNDYQPRQRQFNDLGYPPRRRAFTKLGYMQRQRTFAELGYQPSRRPLTNLGYRHRRRTFADIGFLTSQQPFTDLGFYASQQTFTDLGFMASQQRFNDDDDYFPIATGSGYKSVDLTPQSGIVQWTPDRVSIKIDRQPGRSAGWTPRQSWRNLLHTEQTTSWQLGLWEQGTDGNLFKGFQ